MNRLKELRQEKKLSQKELAKKIGVHYRTLQNWENGESQIKPDKAQKLADHFGVPVGYLLGYSENFFAEETKKLDKLLNQVLELDDGTPINR
ncbi:helix-turn-helix domain-containing protein, partial [Streptococcus suis]